MKKRISFIIAFCFLLSTLYPLLFLTGCKKKEVKVTPEKVVNVQAQPAQKIALRPSIETIGTLNPYEEVIVSAEVDGILKGVKVDEGSVVSKGMILATIDDTDYTLEVKRAEAALKQAEATLSNTRLEYQRKEALYREELVTRQQFDDISTRLSLATAELDRARATLSLAKERLRKTKVISPLSGVVRERKVSEGDYVRNGTNLFVIIQNNPLKLNFTVNEKDVGRLKKGQDVQFKVEALPDREFKGRLEIIYPGLEEKTRSLQVEAVVQNPEGILKPGLFAKVTLYTGMAKDTIVIPSTAILYEAEKSRVFLVEDGRAKERFIKIGQKYELGSGVGSRESRVESRESRVKEYTEVTEGLKEGEMVVTVGQQNLSENTKVNIINSR